MVGWLMEVKGMKTLSKRRMPVLPDSSKTVCCWETRRPVGSLSV